VEPHRVRERRPARRPVEPDGQLGAVRDDERPAHDVAVTADVLGRRVHDDVGAERDRLLQVRRREGVVDREHSTHRARVRSDSADVRDREHRVRGGLDPHELGATGLDRVEDRARVREVDRRVVDAPRAEHARDEPVGAAVRVVGHDDVVARPQRRAQQRVLGCEPRGERERRGAALGRAQRLFERRARRVARARVLVPAAQPADAVLLVGGHLVDGRYDRARAGVRVLSGVDRARREPRLGPVVGAGQIGRRSHLHRLCVLPSDRGNSAHLSAVPPASSRDASESVGRAQARREVGVPWQAGCSDLR